MPGPRLRPRTLAAYLADRDVPCESCGYNLRGVTDAFCPECGLVIPSPPEQPLRQHMNPAGLWCPWCGHTTADADARACPACRATDLLRYTGPNPPPRTCRLVRGIPILLLVNAALGALVVLATGPKLARAVASGALIRLAAACIGFASAALPIAIAAGWWAARIRLRSWTWTERRSATGLAVLAGGIGWFLGLGVALLY